MCFVNLIKVYHNTANDFKLAANISERIGLAEDGEVFQRYE